jgi:hypothetical protein
MTEIHRPLASTLLRSAIASAATNGRTPAVEDGLVCVRDLLPDVLVTLRARAAARGLGARKVA